jgi:hypothetical protein
MVGALWWKEWREQRWRLMLATLVLATFSASLVRAQLMPTMESVLFTFGPLGLLLTIFLAMGSVATERADGTWPFLIAQPLRRATILRTKWAVGAVHLVSAFLLAGAAAHWAAWSRGLFTLPEWPLPRRDTPFPPGGNSAAFVWGVVLLATVSMLAWYTVLFFILTRARNELHAGLGGLLLTLVALLALAQLGFAHMSPDECFFTDRVRTVFWITGLLNPLSPLAALADPRHIQVLASGIAVTLWTAAPVWLIGRLEAPGRWR